MALEPDAIADGKAALLKAVARANGGSGGQHEVLDAALALEEAAVAAGAKPSAALVGGYWSLVYSTQELQGSAGMEASDSIIDRLTAQVYRFFFRFAPALAGAQDRGSEGPRNWWGTPRNEQNVDLDAGTVRNVVEVSPPGPPSSWRLQIVVEGEATPNPGKDGTSLRIIFTRFSAALVGKVPFWLPTFPALPLPRPVGKLETSFVDSDLRVSRGGRGGLFVLRRRKPVKR